MKRARMMRNTGLALALAWGLAAQAQAATTPGADFPSTPPAPAPAPTLHVPTPILQTLPNGLQVVSVQRDRLPLVSAQLLVRSGGERDPANEAGLADLTATLLTKGAGDRSAPQIADAAAALGGELQAGAGWDGSFAQITVTTPKLPQALALLADVVERPSFAEDEVARARTQAIDALHLQFSQPTSLARVVADRAVFGEGAYGHSRAGTPQSLARIGRDDVVALHGQLYRPDNAILVLAGDITPAQALRLAQASFGDWKRPATPLPAAVDGAGDSTLPALLVVDQHGAGQAGVVAAHRAPRRDDRDYFTGSVANAVLGGSYSARLNEEIRIKRGLSYGASSNLDGRRDSGLWLASAQTKNPSAAQVVDLMLGEFARLGSTPVADAELDARKATLVGGYGRSLETTSGLADKVADLALYGIDLDQIGQYVEQVQAVTPAQVQAYAAAHLDAADSHVVVVGDAAQFGAQLAKAHPQLRTVDADALDLDRADLKAVDSKPATP